MSGAREWGVLPHRPGADGVIVDPTAGLAGDDAAIRAAWAEFEAYLLAGLDDGWIRRRRWRDDDQVAAGRLHTLTLTLDEVGRVHVFVGQRPGIGDRERDLAARTLAATSSRVFERLARRWPLRVRRGPFETAPWRPPAPQHRPKPTTPTACAPA